MRMIELQMVTGERANYNEDTETTTGVTETTSPVMLDLEAVRNFYPRKPSAMGEPRNGTRLTFKDGAGMAVTNSYEEVKALYTAH